MLFRPVPAPVTDARGRRVPPGPSNAAAEVELLSIIVPVFNEVATVVAVIDRLLAIDLPVDREIIVVDDGSTDGTREVLAQHPGWPHTRLLRSDRNSGKGHAVRTGLAAARGTIVAIQDADLELDPAELAVLTMPILRGDRGVVYGSRFLSGRPQAPWLTIMANGLLTRLTNLLYGSNLTDMETCYKLMRSDIARSLSLESNGFDIEPEMTAKILRGGHSILELPVRYEARSRSAGKKIGWRDGCRAMQVLLQERVRRHTAGQSR
ncbi:MAG: glycosyltransferase family 2 protein [Acidobacteriota bacterium]